MDYIAGAKMAREKGATKETHQKHTHSWDIWLGFLIRIEKHLDLHLEELDEAGRLRICSAFMHTVRQCDCGRSRIMKQVKGSPLQE